MANKILVVDDERQMRELLKKFLRKEGYEVVEASDGKEAIEVTQKEDPQTILMDINMPIMDGIEACKRLKADERTQLIPVIMITALEDNKEAAVMAGAEDFVDKPFDMLELSVRVKASLRIGHLRDELNRAMAYIQELEKHMP